MGKKKSKFDIDDIGDFDQKPRTVEDLKTGDKTSFYIRPSEAKLPRNPCEVHIAKMMNLDIIKKRGRAEDLSVVYSADQIYNYLSESERYDRAISQGVYPSGVQSREGKTVYLFCSSKAPTGYWEVVIDEEPNATYIRFTKNPLTIICPRPFKLSELTQLETDSKTVQWGQIDGNRTVLITPELSFDPIIDIQASCYTGTCQEDTLSPIILRVESDNPLLFADLYINNRLIDNYYGLGYSGVRSDRECQKVTKLYRVPSFAHRVYQWDGISNLLATWKNPTCDVDYLLGFVAQRLEPPYQTIAEFLKDDNRFISVSPNTRYKIISIFEIFRKQIFAFSDPFFFNLYPFTIPVFADDSTDKHLGYSNTRPEYVTVINTAVVFNFTDEEYIKLGYSQTTPEYTKIVFTVVPIAETDTASKHIGYSNTRPEYTKVNLGGVVIG